MSHPLTPRPMTSARRDQVHGKLQPMEWRDGDRRRLGFGICVASAVFTLSLIAIGISHLLAASEAIPPAASAQHAPAIEAGRGRELPR